MIRLLRAESRRWLARKGLWVAVLGLLAVTALVSAALISSTIPPSGEAVAQAQSAYEKEHAWWVANHESEQDACLADLEAQEPGSSTSAEARADCTTAEPQLEWYTYSPMGWKDTLNSATLAAPVYGAFWALLMGASFVGAEFRSGSLSTWLTHVPGRGRVWTAKMTIAALFGGLVTALAIGLTVAMGAIGVIVNQGLDAAGSWAVPVAQGLRGVVLGALMGLLGGALASLFRNTVAAVAVPLVYLFAQMMFGLFTSLPGAALWSRWLPENNVIAFLQGGYTYWVQIPYTTADGYTDWQSVSHTISLGQSAGYIIVAVALVAMASLLVFRRRDVTD